MNMSPACYCLTSLKTKVQMAMNMHANDNSEKKIMLMLKKLTTAMSSILVVVAK